MSGVVLRLSSQLLTVLLFPGRLDVKLIGIYKRVCTMKTGRVDSWKVLSFVSRKQRLARSLAKLDVVSKALLSCKSVLDMRVKKQ